MGRPLRNTVILAKLETTYGTDAAPVGATDALLVSNVTPPRYAAQNVDRDIVRGFLGGSEQLVGVASVEIGFDIELAGSGTATTPPAWGKLLKACAFAETVQTASVDYTPISTLGASTSLTIYHYLDGQLLKILGARGTFSIEMGVGDRPLMRMRFTGKYGGLTAVANATPTLTAWRVPEVVTDSNTGDISLGAVTYTAATGVVSGGTTYPSRGIRLDIGNNVTFKPLLGGESVEINGRAVTGAFALDLTAAQAVSAMAEVIANTTNGMGFTHGTAAGKIIVLHAPVVQRIEPTVEDFNGDALHAYSLRLVPSAGNDELRIVAR